MTSTSAVEVAFSPSDSGPPAAYIQGQATRRTDHRLGSKDGAKSIRNLDYLRAWFTCRSRPILLYIESIQEARKFVSAARSAARNKPLLAIESGRVNHISFNPEPTATVLARAGVAARRRRWLRVKRISDK